MRTSINDDISVGRMPIGNYIVIVLAVITFAVQFTYDYKQQYLSGLILKSWSASALASHMWLHASVLHIFCNIVFLWVFGRDVCLKIGNAYYPIVYFILGLFSGIVHIFYDGRPAIGASGAIFGILGMYLVLCFRHFSSAGPWIILIWFLLNLAGGVTGYLPTAYYSHLGGFLAGIILASFLVWLNVAERNDADEALVHLLEP